MSAIDWAKAIDIIRNHTVKISTPQSTGTGFLITYRGATQAFGIATAYHVIAHAYEWEEPIRLTHAQTGATRLFRRDDLFIFRDVAQDSAVLLFRDSELGLPTEALGLVPAANFVRPAVTIGWLGYPASLTNELCFFQGVISCYLKPEGSYLVDGVAIHGVSGGPAFHLVEFAERREVQADQIYLLGLVTEYRANRAFGEALPGLCVLRDVRHFHDIIEGLKSIEDARAKEQELASQPASELQPPTPPSSSQ